MPEMVPRLPVEASPEKSAAALTRVSELIDKALKGELPREREPHYWEPSVLTPAHINMVLDRAGGFTHKEISERWDYTPAQVGNVLGHPDAQLIISTILALQAGALTSMEERFKALAPLALNTKVEILQNKEVHPSVRDRVATDLLDRAGYMPRKQVEVNSKHTILVPAQAATGLREILEESARVRSADFSKFLQKSGAEVAAEHFQIESGQPDSVDGASPVQAQASGTLEEKVA